MTSLRRAGLCGLLLAAVVSPAAAAPAAPGTPGLPELRSNAARSRAEQLRAAREYKESLEKLLVFREQDVQRAVEQLERTRDLAGRGIIARGDVAAGERALDAARARLDQTWSEAVVAATLIAKTLADEEMAARPLPPGGEQSTATLVRYQGRRPWVLSLTHSVHDFFMRAFGRALPVSAYGQTPVHDKLGFDHRNAIDVAVHPDSAEGRALMDWLRRAGLSFIAFRGAISGAATGAHIHVGEPSQRLALP
jgi:hypothetical protein